VKTRQDSAIDGLICTLQNNYFSAHHYFVGWFSARDQKSSAIQSVHHHAAKQNITHEMRLNVYVKTKCETIQL